VLIATLDRKNENAWADLFRRAECPCYCRYWHFEGDKNAWLDRCANAPDENFREQSALIGSDAGHALIAMDGERAIGHVKVTPRLSKILARPMYRSLDLGSSERVWCIGCFLVDPAHRGRGVARALVEAAIAFAKARGGVAIEAYPRASTERLRDDEAWMGPENLYFSCGFKHVAGEKSAPVFRRDIGRD